MNGTAWPHFPPCVSGPTQAPIRFIHGRITPRTTVEGGSGPVTPDHAGRAPAPAASRKARAGAERAEREAAERIAREQAQARRERKRRLQELLGGNALNRADAEQPRHFLYKGKIRRVHVTAEQMQQLNAGELGVAVHAGRFLLVTREVALQVQEIDPDALALLVDPDAPASAGDDGVPDDLMW